MVLARDSSASTFSASPGPVSFGGEGEGGVVTGMGASGLRSLSQLSHPLHEAGEVPSLPWPLYFVIACSHRSLIPTASPQGSAEVGLKSLWEGLTCSSPFPCLLKVPGSRAEAQGDGQSCLQILALLFI